MDLIKQFLDRCDQLQLHLERALLCKQEFDTWFSGLTQDEINYLASCEIVDELTSKIEAMIEGLS